MWKIQRIETFISLLFWSYSCFKFRATELFATISFSSIQNIVFFGANPAMRFYLFHFVPEDIHFYRGYTSASVSCPLKPTYLKNDKTNNCFTTFLTIFAKEDNQKSNKVDVFILRYVKRKFKIELME
jgi:hypothetical protein